MKSLETMPESTSSSSEPSLSVVIAWVNPLALIEPVIEALESQTAPPEEIIVVTRHPAPLQQKLRSLCRNVVLEGAPPSASIPKLRSIGLRRARGSIVAVTEDHCVPPPGWAARIRFRIRDGSDVVGGPVENACTSRVRDWAAFLTEYAGVVRPNRDGVVNGLPGNNVAYRRDLVVGLSEVLDRGLWESFYHDRLAREGLRLTFDPALVINHQRTFDFWYFITQRYHFCRSFAGMRCASLRAAGRLKYGIGSALLPPLLFLRNLRHLLERRRLVGRYLFCSPLIGAYMTAGAVGEMVGYFLGGGDSIRKVE